MNEQTTYEQGDLLMDRDALWHAILEAWQIQRALDEEDRRTRATPPAEDP